MRKNCTLKKWFCPTIPKCLQMLHFRRCALEEVTQAEVIWIKLSKRKIIIGSSIRNIASIIDEDFTGVKLIRPLRNISIKEIELVNELQTTTKLYKNRTVSISRNEPQSCIQSICKHFLGGLQDGGFVSTIDTILSSSSKVDSRRKNDTKCRFCFADYLQEEEEFTVKFCPPCSTLLSELTDTIKNRIVCLIWSGR